MTSKGSRGGTAILGVVLAGGLSRRMGGTEKTLLELDGKPLLSHALDRLGPQVSRIAVNANGNPSRFRRFNVGVVDDGDDERRGPLAGVLAGMRLARKLEISRVATAAGDTPFFPLDLVPVLALASELQSAPIALAASREERGSLRLHPTFGLWDAALLEDLEASLAAGTRKILDWTDTHWAVPAEFPSPEGDPFFNINTPEDLEQARKRLPSEAS